MSARLLSGSEVVDDSDSSSSITWEAIVSNILLFLLIYGLSATVNFENLKHQLKNKRAFLVGLGIQYLFMPFLGFIFVSSFTKWSNGGFTPAMGIVLLVITSSPGGSLSNWWCATFNAELALSVAFSAVSSICSIALLPANVFLYTFLVYRNYDGSKENEDESENTTDFDQSNVLQSLNFVTLIATLCVALLAMGLGIASGYFLNKRWFHAVCHRAGSVSGLILIFFSVKLTSGGDNNDSNLEDGTSPPTWWNQHWSLYVATIVPCCIGVATSHLLARRMGLTGPETVALTIECCYQNTGIALSVAISMFSDPLLRAQAVAVPLIYGITDAVLVCLYCLYSWKAGRTKAPANENLCLVVIKSYEFDMEHDTDVVDDENDSDSKEQQEGHQNNDSILNDADNGDIERRLNDNDENESNKRRTVSTSNRTNDTAYSGAIESDLEYENVSDIEESIERKIDADRMRKYDAGVAEEVFDREEVRTSPQ